MERLETGTSIAAVARAFAVNPNVLHGWQREFRHGSGQCFPGAGKRRWDERPPLGPNPPTARPASRRRSSALPCACSAICLFPFLSLKSYSMDVSGIFGTTPLADGVSAVPTADRGKRGIARDYDFYKSEILVAAEPKNGASHRFRDGQRHRLHDKNRSLCR